MRVRYTFQRSPQGGGHKPLINRRHPRVGNIYRDSIASLRKIDLPDAPLFRPVKNNSSGTLDKHLEGSSVYRHIVVRYGKQAGIAFAGFCPHARRATAATNTRDHGADIPWPDGQVQKLENVGADQILRVVQSSP